jgi:UDP-2,3-diacylglucosamine hydrolase
LAASVNKLGLIAGNGVFPLEVARAARARGVKIVAVAHLNESDRALDSVAGDVTWIKVGELQKIIDVFKNAGVVEAAMAGGISRARLKDSFAPDARALKMLAGIGRFSDDAVLRGIAREVESEGIKMIDPVPMIDHWLARAGVAAGPDPTPAQMRDLELAFAVARRLGSFDIGQTVAVRDGMVAAVEALEGTDVALRRAAGLVGAGLVVAKAAKPGQDLRFDRPAIGPATVELLAELGASMLGVEAGVALILERDRTLELARAKNVTVFGYAETGV